MSDLDEHPLPVRSEDGPKPVASPVHETLSAREAQVGADTFVRRLLPHRQRRLVGPWCFFDHYGPVDVLQRQGMLVPPHPHVGLQTVSWLFHGDVLHRDSLGSEQMVRPGELNLMTAGEGIAHSEESPTIHHPVLHGVQLWIALPDEYRNVAPAFDHYDALPVMKRGGFRVTVLAGELDGARSPATVYSPLSGFELHATEPSKTTLRLDPDFEYAASVVSGVVTVDGERLQPRQLVYLGCGRESLSLRTEAESVGPPDGPRDGQSDAEAETGSRLLLLGGRPFNEDILMWWNFVARTGDEITVARADWEAGRHFGEVVGFAGERLSAPPIPPGKLKPRH
jgi:redox-sensitive bicupin YhaK (pirin superfamily)